MFWTVDVIIDIRIVDIELKSGTVNNFHSRLIALIEQYGLGHKSSE